MQGGWTAGYTHVRAQGRGDEAGTVIIPIGQMETLRHRVVTHITRQVSGVAVSPGSSSRVHALNYMRPNLKLWLWDKNEQGGAEEVLAENRMRRQKRGRWRERSRETQ